MKCKHDWIDAYYNMAAREPSDGAEYWRYALPIRVCAKCDKIEPEFLEKEIREQRNKGGVG